MRPSVFRRVPALGLALLLAACAQVTGRSNEGATADMDERSRALHARMMEAMGGEEGWRNARYLEFDFAVAREGEEGPAWRHRWDRWEGAYRLSGVRGQDTLLALFDIDAPRQGRVWVNGAAASGPRADSLLDFAYARFINDSYWLLMPYKWTDPGVRVRYEGEETDEEGRRWETVRLTFDDVGLTPQNQYVAMLDPESGLMERWRHYRTGDADPLVTDWRDWRRFGPILLATDKPTLDGSFAFRFHNVRVETAVPEGAFRAP